jgi:2-iminobutanoate/2-iminopropanoate deaminase
MAGRSIYLPGSKGLVPDAAVRGGFLFSGGVAGRDTSGGLPETHEEQAALAYDRVGAILDQAGYSWEEIGHWFIWAPDRHSRIAPINPHWEQHFPDPRSRPARHALARQLDPGVQYRIEIIGVKNAPRTSYEINDRVYHTGGSATPGFMPFGTTMGDVLFTGPTYGMYRETRKMGETPRKQAELCFSCNQELYAMTGHTLDNLAQMFVWYHDEETRKAAIDFTGAMFPDPNDRPAIQYIYSQLPYWNDPEVMGQFLVQYDIIGVRGGRRRVIQPAGVRTMDGAPAGVAMGDLLFTSVCLAPDPSGSLEAQARQAFQAVRQVVEAGGFAPSDIGHIYVWYTGHEARETVDKVWAEVFPNADDRPACHCVVADLPAGALIGVEATAAR